MIHAWYNKSFQIHHGILHTFLVVQHGRSKRTKELWPCLALGKSERRGPAGSQGCDIFTEVEGNPTSFGEPLVCEPSRPPEAGQGLEGEVACPSAWYTEISPVGVTWNFLRDRETKGMGSPSGWWRRISFTNISMQLCVNSFKLTLKGA